MFSLKTQKLSKEYNTFMQNIEQCLEIANEVKESIFDANNDENVSQANSHEQRHNVIIKNLDIFIELFQKFNKEIYKLYSMLDLTGKCYDINHFTYPENDVNEYKVNDVGECVISNTDSVVPHHCHIYNVKKPPMVNLEDYQGERFMTLPASGEVFAIKLGSDDLCRAVRNDFMNEGSESMRIQLMDTGKIRGVRKKYKSIISITRSNSALNLLNAYDRTLVRRK